MNPAGERVLKALTVVGPSSELTLPQAAFNFLTTPFDVPEAERLLKEALERWADSVLGPEEGPNGEGRWGDDGGTNLT
jgi:hypothetical protein